MNAARQIRQMVWLWFTSLGIAMGTVSAAAQEGTDADLPAVEEDEPIIPRAYPEDRYLAIWEKSPFMLEAAPEPLQAQKSFARDYFLVGYVDSKNETVIYLKNQKSGESVRIPPFNKDSSEGPAFKFLELKKAPNPMDVRVTVSLSGETADIGYDPASFSQPASPGQVPAIDTPGKSAIPGDPGRVGSTVNGRAANIGSPNPDAAGQAQPIGKTPSGAAPQENAGPYVNPAAEKLRQQQEAAKARGANAPGRPGLPQSPAGRRRIILPTAPDR